MNSEENYQGSNPLLSQEQIDWFLEGCENDSEDALSDLNDVVYKPMTDKHFELIDRWIPQDQVKGTVVESCLHLFKDE